LKPARSYREEAAISTTEYILDESDVGAVFPEVDGYLLSLVRSRGPNHRGSTSPNWNDTHFILRDSPCFKGGIGAIEIIAGCLIYPHLL
jgi:hypothetical protein